MKAIFILLVISLVLMAGCATKDVSVDKTSSSEVDLTSDLSEVDTLANDLDTSELDNLDKDLDFSDL